MRIGLIGCGNVGVNAHIPAAQANEGLTIVAAADPTPERLEAAAAAADYVWHMRDGRLVTCVRQES